MQIGMFDKRSYTITPGQQDRMSTNKSDHVEVEMNGPRSEGQPSQGPSFLRSDTIAGSTVSFHNLSYTIQVHQHGKAPCATENKTILHTVR